MNRKVKLSDGSEAEITSEKIKGKHYIAAERALDKGASEFQRSCAIIAQVVKINDKPIIYEDVTELALEDINLLTMAVMGSDTPKP